MLYCGGMFFSRAALFPIFVFLLLLLPSATAIAAMSSTNYQVPWDSFVSGGLEQGTSAQYRLQDTIGGGFDGADMSSSAYAARAGYRVGDERPLMFDVAVAPVGGVSALYTTVSISGRTVTLVSEADAGSFSVGDKIAVVENRGLNQLVVVGKITAISGGVLSVDRFDGDTGAVSSPVTAGSGQVLLLSGSAVSFGSVSAATASVATGWISVTSDVRSGYTVYAVADGRPRTTGGDDIDPVTDGTVSLGAEEYGIEYIGSRAAASGDVACTTTRLAVQSSTNVSGTPADRTAFSYKLSINAAQTQAGTYSQAVSYTLTPNY